MKRHALGLSVLIALASLHIWIPNNPYPLNRLFNTLSFGLLYSNSPVFCESPAESYIPNTYTITLVKGYHVDDFKDHHESMGFTTRMQHTEDEAYRIEGIGEEQVRILRRDPGVAIVNCVYTKAALDEFEAKIAPPPEEPKDEIVSVPEEDPEAEGAEVESWTDFEEEIESIGGSVEE